VNTYQVTSELAGFSVKRQLLRGFFTAGLSAASEIITNMLWPSMASGHVLEDVLEDIIAVGISSIIFAFWFVKFTKRNLNYRVVISDDCITAVHPLYERSVRRNEVKTVVESSGSFWTAPSLRISKYGRLGTWFWGGIWIPRALPEYDSVKNLALSWQGSTQV
jgi:hypothetical protein